MGQGIRHEVVQDTHLSPLSNNLTIKELKSSRLRSTLPPRIFPEHFDDFWNNSFPASPAELFRGHDVRIEQPELLDDLYQRARVLDDLCQKNHTPGEVIGLFTHDPSRVAYCFLPKAGCTFWIRVFSFLHNFTGDAVDTPWKLSRLKIHNNRNSHGELWGRVRGKVRDYIRFLFVRHPFSRLWSAYLDKFFLPDFWHEIGVPAVINLRGKKATKRALKCGNDLTFAEFVEFSLKSKEPHWDPIYLRCDPCQFRPSVVGSMSSFTRDSLFLLRRMGLEWVLKDMDYNEQEEQELATLIDYNFDLIRSRTFYKSCINDTQLSNLLWQTFQMNGYIRKEWTYHSTSFSTANSVNEFKQRVIESYRGSLPVKKQLKQQKKDFLRKALSSLPSELLERVKKKYEMDMIYFGFDEDNY